MTRRKTSGTGDTPANHDGATDAQAPGGVSKEMPSGPGPQGEVQAPEAPAGETGETGSAQGGEGPPAKRRRGTRGGRRHRKPATTPQAEDAQGVTARTPEEPVSRVQARQDAPEPDVAGAPQEQDPGGSADEGASAGDDTPGTTPAKRRRRGSRGGRRRRKGGEAGAAEGVPEAEEKTGEAEPPVAAPAGPVVPAAAGTGSEAPAVAAAQDEASAGAGTEDGPKPRRRRARGRGRGKHSGAAEEGSARAEEEPLSAAVESAPVAPPEAEAAAPSKDGRTPRKRGRRRAQGTATAGAAPDAAAPAPETTEPEAASAAAAETPVTDGGEEASGPRKRRRGGRRPQRDLELEEAEEAVVAVEEEDSSAAARPGKSRRAKSAAQVAADEADEPEEAVRRPAADQEGRATPASGPKGKRRDHRRPRAIVRQDEGSGLGAVVDSGRRPAVVAQLPERKIILVTDDGHELRVALVEDGRLAEIYIERPDKKSYLGDIYQGKVDNVMTGIDAAFVDFGLEKNGFLYVDEVRGEDGEKRARRIGEAVKKGQQVLVQVTKDPMGSKGARLSMKISLAGRYLVYVPGGSGVGISRRLRQSERDRLRDVAKELKAKNAGLIVRTIAEGHGLEDLKRDLRYLSRLWSRLKKKAETVKPPGLVHKEVDISVEVARDLFNETCESLIVDDPKRHKALVSFLDKEAPELLPKVHLHTGSEPLFEAYGIEEQIARALERRVLLPSGGNLVIDHAEALTVIDVNTGRFAGGKGLEETITHTNLEAAREVVRQLRLRDIGGIIIIDFIDMARAKNRETVLATLEAELETDRTKTYVVELSPLGLVEMTRQNTTDGARGIMTRSCPACVGKARVLNDETAALMAERRVRSLARRSQAAAWLIEVNAAVAERLSGARLKGLEKQTGRRVFFEGGSGLPIDAFHVVAEGPSDQVQEQRIPVHEGQEVEVELEFSLTYSPRDAVAYVEGYMVIVEGGRQFLGQRRKVRITGTARTGASAVVAKKPSN